MSESTAVETPYMRAVNIVDRLLDELDIARLGLTIYWTQPERDGPASARVVPEHGHVVFLVNGYSPNKDRITVAWDGDDSGKRHYTRRTSAGMTFNWEAIKSLYEGKK